MRKNLKNKVFALLLVLSVFVSAMATNSISAAGAKFTGEGTDKIVTSRGASTSVVYTYANEDGGIFRSIQATYEWDPDLMEFDSISGDHFEIVTSGSDIANGKLEVGFRYYTGIRTNTPELTINFKNCFSDPSKASSATITSGYKPNAAGNLVVNYVSTAGNYTVAQGEEDITDAVVTLNLPVSVVVSPTSATVTKGETQTFTSTVTNDDGSGVTWSVNGTDSSISSTGVLSVGDNETATSLSVSATSVKDTSKKATATVSVSNKPSLSLDMSADATQVFKGEASSVQFAATPTTTAATPTTVTYAVSGNNDAGTTVDANGLLTISAAETADTLTVTATAANSKTDPATTTTSKSVSLVEIGVSVTPTTATLARGATHTFGSTVDNDLNSDGVVWSITGNTSTATLVDANGKVTVGADETATSFIVTATSVKDVTKSASATITVAEVTVAIDVTPTEVVAGEVRQLSATLGNDETGSGVTWSLTGNTSAATSIDSNGKLTVGADEAAGTQLTITVTSTTDSTKTSTIVLNVAKLKFTQDTDGSGKVEVTEGDEITLTPTVKGGTWTYDNEFLKASISSKSVVALPMLTGNSATFEATKVGVTTVTYTVNGVSVNYEVTIKEKAIDPTKPILPTVPGKPSTAPGGTTTSPTTGDATNMTLLLSLLGVSMLGIVVGVKRRKIYSK